MAPWNGPNSDTRRRLYTSFGGFFWPTVQIGLGLVGLCSGSWYIYTRCTATGCAGKAGILRRRHHDTDTDILARIVADTSDTRDFLKLFLRQAERHVYIFATILTKMSVSTLWNAELTQRIPMEEFTHKLHCTVLHGAGKNASRVFYQQARANQ